MILNKLYFKTSTIRFEGFVLQVYRVSLKVIAPLINLNIWGFFMWQGNATLFIKHIRQKRLIECAYNVQ